MENEKRCAIYCRVSSIDQNTELQRCELENYAKARGWTITNIFQDKATGSSSNRPQFQQMMMDARLRKIDVVLVWKLDRFSRSMKDLILSLQELSDLAVSFVSLRDQIDLTTATGKLMMHLLASFSEFELSLIRTRVRAGLENAKRNGKKLGRPKTRDAKKILELHSQGLSQRKIAARLGISKGSVQKALKLDGPKTR